jgi:hypothetical protein
MMVLARSATFLNFQISDLPLAGKISLARSLGLRNTHSIAALGKE